MTLTKRKFGHALRHEFLLEDGYVPMNHGSYGVCPRSVQAVRHEWQLKAEQNPDRFLKFTLWPELDKIRERLSRLVHCDRDELVFVVNASFGINSVVRSLSLKQAEKVLVFNTLYNAVDRTMAYLKDTRNVQLVMIELAYPMTDQQVYDTVKSTIDREHAKDPDVPIRMAMFDAVSSVPAVRFPFERVIQLCREHNILSVVDGAHALGQIPLDLHQADPDFFIGNCHKWLFAPRGAAILYVPKRNQALVHPSVINVSYQDHSVDQSSSTFCDEFAWPGTIDFTNFVCVNAALDFRESLGGEEAIHAYCNKLARQGGELVAKKWGTHMIENEEETLTVAMANVQLPFENKAGLSDAIITRSFFHKLIFDHHTTGQPFKHNGHWYLRLSAQVYNELADFEHLADAGLQVCKELDNQQ
ncbi:hypothetical protein O0I10_005146 [Lichtheimia ornata]|uniref:Aminotransferase class V domain-containing protein n=1 Tax=Lichtheimia ornata TaxID=688661 RepID=A0AAD7Y1S1_9FUNG|nr:uncharacterized protein O0I10_005146 [Lichtheimia ornata]KAJ8659107.1 hypothetical protein O0I10_005146 [Lichtheimia ornata]